MGYHGIAWAVNTFSNKNRRSRNVPHRLVIEGHDESKVLILFYWKPSSQRLAPRSPGGIGRGAKPSAASRASARISSVRSLTQAQNVARWNGARRSVSRVLSRANAGMAIHLGRSSPNASRDRPERRRGRPARRRRLLASVACRSYLVLLPVGFAVPPPLPAARCALTAPFHPCRPLAAPRCARRAWRCIFCGTFPGVAPAGRYPAPRLRGARTFLTARIARRGHPTVWPGIMWDRPPRLSKCREAANHCGPVAPRL